jgi:dinuclear metal center YbgI/SA1388 family protein
MAIEQDDLFEIFDLIAPPELAESWDNVGPQIISDSSKKITKVLLALDCTESVLKEALKTKAQLIVSHHPLIFSPLYRLIDYQYPYSLIQAMIRSEISLFVMHTNLDKAIGGVNDALARTVGLVDISPLETAIGGNQTTPETGFGRIGNYSKSKKLGYLCQVIKECLGLEKIRFIGDYDIEVKRMAVCSGSGAGYLQEALKKGAQALLTGDVKYHQAREAQGYGMALIDAGHFATERIILPLLKERIIDIILEKGYGKDFVVTISRTEEDPFQTL